MEWAAVLDISLLIYDKLILTRLKSCYLISVLLILFILIAKDAWPKLLVHPSFLLFSPQPHIICLLLTQTGQPFGKSTSEALTVPLFLAWKAFL